MKTERRFVVDLRKDPVDGGWTGEVYRAPNPRAILIYSGASAHDVMEQITADFELGEFTR